MSSTEFKERDEVRIVALPSGPRLVVPGQLEKDRGPQIGDVGVVVGHFEEKGRRWLIVERCDAGGKTLWVSNFEPRHVELVSAA